MQQKVAAGTDVLQHALEHATRQGELNAPAQGGLQALKAERHDHLNAHRRKVDRRWGRGLLIACGGGTSTAHAWRRRRAPPRAQHAGSGRPPRLTSLTRADRRVRSVHARGREAVRGGRRGRAGSGAIRGVPPPSFLALLSAASG